MRKLIFLFPGVLLIISLHAGPIDLSEAIDRGLLTADVEGLGGNMGKTLLLRLDNPGRRDLEVRIPAGLIFQSADTSLQDLIVVREQVLKVEGRQKRSARLYALCTQAGNRSPGVSSVFRLGLLAGPKLLQVASFISEQKLYEEQAAQYAVWAITDGHRLEHITHPELAAFVAGVLGVPPPAYAVRHKNPAIPGQPAFQPHPLSVEGVFRYELSADQKVSFGLFNEAGEPIHYFFQDQLQKKGFGKFTFAFEIRNLPPGRYTVRMVGESEILSQMEVVW